jgi:uncharacterized phage infection (PIP) family protein YhgE
MQHNNHKGAHEPRYNELFRRFDRIQTQIDEYIKESNRRLQALEESHITRGERLNSFSQVVNTLQSHLERMEQGLLQEFKISQEIMRGMIEHDMSIERAKTEFKQQLETKEQEMKQQQAAREAEEQKERAAFRRNLYIKLGTIGAPVLVAATTAIVKIIESF